MTRCSNESFGFHNLGGREVVARFDGGMISSDAGGLLLLQTDEATGLTRRFAECFADHRDAELIEHTAEEMIKQRVFGLALGYEDLNDHDQLRHDPLMAILVGKRDPSGQDRLRERDRGKALAGKSTLNRLELTPVGADEKSRYKKIVASSTKIENFFVDAFLDAHSEPPSEMIILDLDATDDPLHGEQAGRFFHGYYKSYCYLPLYIFCGEHLLCAKLRPSDIDASAGSVKQLARIVASIRERWPTVKILIRGDSGFCRDAIMSWCEANHVHFLLGLAKNARLIREIADQMRQAKERSAQLGKSARVYKDFTYRTLDSWSRPRRVVGKAESLVRGENPRFVVTSLPAAHLGARTLYERIYCPRGDMENRIKEQQLYLFADRTSCSTMRANQLRLWLSSAAYVLMTALRKFGLQGTQMANAQCQTIRRKLLKIGARIRITCRKIWISLASGCPYQKIFSQVHANLARMVPTHAKRARLVPTPPRL